MDNFHKWIDRKYKEWSNDGDKSVDAFAVYLGINGGTVGTWLRKTRGQPQSKEIIDLLVKKYGNEVYEVLGFSVPGFDAKNWDNFLSACRDLVDESSRRKLPTNSPEFSRLVSETFGKHGFTMKISD